MFLGGLDPTPPDPGVLAVLPHALLALAALLALLLARHDREHWPVAWALALMTGSSFGGWALLPLLHGGPYVGWYRVAFHASEALYLVDRFALIWVALRVLLRRRIGPELSERERRYDVLHVVLAVYALAVGALVCGYPYPFRGDALLSFYLGAELLALVVSFAAAQHWASHTRRNERPSPEVRLPWQVPGPSASVRSVLALTLGNLALLFVGSFPRGLWGYRAQEGGLIALWGGVAALQAHALARKP